MNKLNPIIFWEGFPVCGLLIKKVVENYPNLVVLATKPSIPFKDLEKILNKKIIWLPENFNSKFLINKYNHCNLFIHTGWNNREILKFSKYIKKKNKAKIYVAVDNNLRFSFRQIIGFFYYRLYFSRLFDGALVTGKKSRDLMIFFGLKPNKIHIGLYGAYENIFFKKNNISNRKNEFLFVGQFSERKSINLLLEAFQVYRLKGGSWNLRIIGSGTDLKKIKNKEGIIIENFMQPFKVAERMNEAKVFVLLSKVEHWGTVVCEAAACGMNLLLTKNIGSKEDLLIPGINGYEISSHSIKCIVGGFSYFEKMNLENLIIGSEKSINISKLYNSDTYFKAFINILQDEKFKLS